MEEFPFTAEEWDRVGEMSTAIVNASIAEDKILNAAHTAEMHALLNDLEAIYGEHPILIETHADYTSDRDERLRLYRRALELSRAHGFETYMTVISLAEVLIEDFGNLAAARSELLACADEFEKCDDDYYQERWRDLLAKCTGTE